MTQEPKTNGRELAWLDTLNTDELDVTKRLEGMNPQMQTFWLAVQLHRMEKSLALGFKKGITPATLTGATAVGGAIVGGIFAALKAAGVL